MREGNKNRVAVIYQLLSIFPPRIKLITREEFWEIWEQHREFCIHFFHPALYILHKVTDIPFLSKFTWKIFSLIRDLFEKVFGKCITLIVIK